MLTKVRGHVITRGRKASRKNEKTYAKKEVKKMFSSKVSLKQVKNRTDINKKEKKEERKARKKKKKKAGPSQEKKINLARKLQDENLQPTDSKPRNKSSYEKEVGVKGPSPLQGKRQERRKP